MKRRQLMRAGGGLLLAGLTPALRAHGLRLGELLIDHPYALPTLPQERSGSVYFRRLANLGRQAERLLGASTALAARVEIQRGEVEPDGLRMRAVPALELPPGASLQPRHGGPLQLRLLDLRQPLRNGDRFELLLQFERAGPQAVVVWVQQPREADIHRHAPP